MNYKFRSFDIDYNMIFVIQTYHNESTEDILSALHEAATSIVTESLKTTRAKGLHKRAKFFYKKSKIPIMIVATSGYIKRHLEQNPNQPLPVDIDIRFPKKQIRIDAKMLDEMAAHKFEQSIGLRDDGVPQLANLENPVVELPRGLKGVL